MAQTVKNPPEVRETGLLEFLCWENPLEEGLATDSNVIAWRIPKDMESHGRPWQATFYGV